LCDANNVTKLGHRPFRFCKAPQFRAAEDGEAEGARRSARARSVGVEPRYDQTVRSVEELGDVDLIIAADGVNSMVRRGHEAEFGTSVSHLANRFVWYGTTKRFETLTQTFVETELGTFNAHHYRYAPDISTFIVECDPATFDHAGFARIGEDETRAVCERAFAEALDGHELTSNKSVWRQFPWFSNERWSSRNVVLVGDALRTAHFSIGSGTRLALEDVIASSAV
jgi:2-polyprenyl-6-methoxyphenol hydroxylase-like FAD-dependent oxidoreductase